MAGVGEFFNQNFGTYQQFMLEVDFCVDLKVHHSRIESFVSEINKEILEQKGVKIFQNQIRIRQG